MDKLFENLETNIKLAYKSVTFHFKSFIWFYIALFIVQASTTQGKSLKETIRRITSCTI